MTKQQKKDRLKELETMLSLIEKNGVEANVEEIKKEIEKLKKQIEQ